MKLLNKIFNKKGSGGNGSDSGSSRGHSQPSSPAASSFVFQPTPNGSPYHYAVSGMSPRTGVVDAAKVLRVLGAESKDQEIQIINTMAMQSELQQDCTDSSLDEDELELEEHLLDGSPGFLQVSRDADVYSRLRASPERPRHSSAHLDQYSRTQGSDGRRKSDSYLLPDAFPRFPSDTDTIDLSCESTSMSPTPSSHLSPANDPWCRSPQQSPRPASPLASPRRDTGRPAHPLPTPPGTPPRRQTLRNRVGSLSVATPRPLPLPPSENNLSSAVASRMNTSQPRPRDLVRSPLPSPSSSPLRSPYFMSSPHYSPQRSPPPLSPQRSPTRSVQQLCPRSWKRLQELGRGSFGTVYEGFNKEDGSFFAIKVIDDSSITEETQQEVAVLSQLNHPNIVRYLGTHVDEDGHLCIFLELMKCSVKTILDKLATGFKESMIRAYTRQILYGLVYLHEQRTIHRDIKCANILVDSRGQIKLADFGVAKQTNQASSLKGTPIYMAPEVMNPNPSNRSYGTQVDIWSLGCTVLEMADGKPPWSHLPGFGFYFKIWRGEAPPIPDHLSPVARDFIQQCLLLKPEDRPTAADLLQHQFVRDAPSSVPSFVSPLASPRASPMHRQNGTRLQEPHFHPIEGLRRNGNLNLMGRESYMEDAAISEVIHRTRSEPQQIIFRAQQNINVEPALEDLQGFIM